MALGAARSRLIRQMLVESLFWAALEALVGIALAYGGARMILALAFPDSPNLPIHASPSLAVLAFAFALSLLTDSSSASSPHGSPRTPIPPKPSAV